jgi:hypothetical protein
MFRVILSFVCLTVVFCLAALGLAQNGQVPPPKPR